MNIALSSAAIINPFKLLSSETDGATLVVVACVDGIVGFVVGALSFLHPLHSLGYAALLICSSAGGDGC
jgi:hypothetical protein